MFSYYLQLLIFVIFTFSILSITSTLFHSWTTNYTLYSTWAATNVSMIQLSTPASTTNGASLTGNYCCTNVTLDLEELSLFDYESIIRILQCVEIVNAYT